MASEIKVDTVSEKTSGSGVTIDGLLIKDGGISGDVSLIGTTPTFTIGDAGAEDATLLFDGNAQDFHIGLDDSADDLVIGVGSALGTTTALAIDENANSTFSGTVTVGVDDTGKDVKFFGATSGAYMLWDESTDDLVLAGAAKLYLYDAGGGENLSSDGTDLTITSGADINLTATTDINIPANVGITFGDDAEKIEGDGTDLTISGNNINLTATADVVIPANVGITFGTGEKIEGDSTNLTITSGADIALTATNDINVPANVGMTFGDDGEKIEGDGTDLTIASSAKINLTATSDVHIPNNVGIVFGGDSEKIEGDGTDMTISANNLTVDAAADITLDAAGNNFKFSSGGTQILDIANSSSNIIIKPTVDAKDIIFQQYDGNEVMRINDSRKLQFYDDGGESITSDGSKLIIESGGTTFNLPTSDGSNGQAITTNGSGVLAFADAGGGKVLQVVSNHDDSKSSSTSTSAVYWINQAITPSSANSKILVLGRLTASHNDENTRTGSILKRDSTTFTNSGAEWENHYGGSTNRINDYTHNTGPTSVFMFLDSPSTTNSTTYYLGTNQTGGTTYYNQTDSGNVEHTSDITLIEIGA